MQKIFRKYIIIIMSISLASVLLINFFLSTDSLQARTLETFNLKINQVIQTIENNRTELVSLKSSLDEDYLTRAKAFAYVIEKNPNIIESVTELQNLATLLDVDELHVSDSEGLIAYSSVPKYVGLDFHNGEQMRGFLPILESDDPDEYVIQDAQPNTAEGKIMKYVGVARKDKKGLVQVGLEPTRLLEAQQRNTYSYIFSRFPTNEGEQLFAINKTTNELIASTNDLDDKEASYYTYDNLKDCQSGTFKDIGNKTEIEIPNEIENISVKKIDITCFVHNKIIETVVVPKSVYQINSWAFAGCKSLEKIIINNPDTLFGDCVFIDTNAMICAQKNSKVEKYATDNNIKFEELN